MRAGRMKILARPYHSKLLHRTEGKRKAITARCVALVQQGLGFHDPPGANEPPRCLRVFGIGHGPFRSTGHKTLARALAKECTVVAIHEQSTSSVCPNCSLTKTGKRVVKLGKGIGNGAFCRSCRTVMEHDDLGALNLAKILNSYALGEPRKPTYDYMARRRQAHQLANAGGGPRDGGPDTLSQSSFQDSGRTSAFK